MRCPECSRFVKATDNYCRHCGEDLRETDFTTMNLQQKKRIRGRVVPDEVSTSAYRIQVIGLNTTKATVRRIV